MGSLEESRIDFRSVLNGKRVFLTGHTGFKGSWLALWLAQRGAQVTGYSLAPPTEPSNFEAAGIEQQVADHLVGDVRDLQRLQQAISAAAPNVIFHLAAQPLVRASYRQPRETLDTNIMGTANLLETVRCLAQPCAVVIVTTDKCYENDGQIWGFRENDRLGGHDPYSASKAACEIVAASYRDSFFPPSRLEEHGVQLATARAGNVIGGGDWAADRIVVDIVKALVAGDVVELRNPRATRPWQHVLEPLSGYCQLAAAMLTDPHPRWSSAWNFGPLPGEERTVLDLTKACISYWGSGSWVDRSGASQPHEARQLRLAIDKAVTLLGWTPRWDFTVTVRRTLQWYHTYYHGPTTSMADDCLADIRAYEQQMFEPAANGWRDALPENRLPHSVEHQEERRRAG